MVFFSSKEGVFLSKEGVIIAPQSLFLGGKIRLQILQILFNQISLAHTHVTRSRIRAREREKNRNRGGATPLTLRVCGSPPYPLSLALLCRYRSRKAASFRGYGIISLKRR